MKKIITLSALLVATVAGLAGCNSEQTKSVDYYYKHQDELSKKVDWCYDHSDQKSTTNCKNALAANDKVDKEMLGF